MLRVSRVLPRIQACIGNYRNGLHHSRTLPYWGCSSRYTHHRHDPFKQMESFMRDVERRFWREADQIFRNFPFPRLGSRNLLPRVGYEEGAVDASTANAYKLEFYFPRAKPDDIKVTLKDRTLTVEAKEEESTETSKYSQSYSYQYTVPDGVDIEALESSFSDGVLTVLAPRMDKTVNINIKRE